MTNLQEHLAYYNKGNDLDFDEPTHTYRNENGQVYLSVTQFLGQFEEEFDAEFWGMYSALKSKGKKVKPELKTRSIFIAGKKHALKDLMRDAIFINWYDETRAKWKGINAEACHRGNVKHNYLEDTINKSKGLLTANSDNYLIKPLRSDKPSISTVNDLDVTDLEEVHPEIYNRLKLYIEKGCSIFAEKKVRLDLARLAGTIDVPIIKNGTKKFCIVDWKTNKDEFHPTSGYYKKELIGGEWVKTDNFIVTDDRFKYPLAHLPLCKLHVYYLQLSLYAYIMETWGYTLVDRGLEIIHIRPGAKPKLIKVPYLIDEVELIIKYRLEELGLPFFDVKNFNKI